MSGTRTAVELKCTGSHDQLLRAVVLAPLATKSLISDFYSVQVGGLKLRAGFNIQLVWGEYLNLYCSSFGYKAAEVCIASFSDIKCFRTQDSRVTFALSSVEADLSLMKVY